MFDAFYLSIQRWLCVFVFLLKVLNRLQIQFNPDQKTGVRSGVLAQRRQSCSEWPRTKAGMFDCLLQKLLDDVVEHTDALKKSTAGEMMIQLGSPCAKKSRNIFKIVPEKKAVACLCPIPSGSGVFRGNHADIHTQIQLVCEHLLCLYLYLLIICNFLFHKKTTSLPCSVLSALIGPSEVGFLECNPDLCESKWSEIPCSIEAGLCNKPQSKVA